MALPNGDLITTVFDPQMAYPVDKRMQVDTLNSRDSISMYIRWEGMTVYVLEDSKIYILQGGRSNEYWKELGTGSGTGGTTFVGQFATADLLPTSGRSAGDYAFVGTGEDFVQYNWDNIANEWVMAEGQTDLASEHFHIGYKTPLRRPVIFRRDPKDVIIEDSGDIIIDTWGESANFILTGEVTSVRGIISATEGREIHLTNRTGSDVLLVDEYTSTSAENRFNFGGSDYTLSNGETIALKSEDDRWVLGYVNQVAFSDTLDSVSSVKGIGPDGLAVLGNVWDTITGEYVTFKQMDNPPVIDGRVFVESDGVTYKREFSGFITATKIGLIANEESKGVENYTKLLTIVKAGLPVLIDDLFHIDPSAGGYDNNVSSDIHIEGIDHEKGKLIIHGGTVFNTTSSKVRIKNLGIEAPETLVTSLLYFSPDFDTVLEVDGNKITGNIRMLYASVPSAYDHETTFCGFRSVSITKNICNDIRVLTGTTRATFMFVDCPVTETNVTDNQVTDFSYMFLMLSIVSGHPSVDYLWRSRKNVNILRNTVYCNNEYDAKTVNSGDTPLYYCFSLIAADSVTVKDNTFEGIHIVDAEDTVVYDNYINCVKLTYQGNIWKNNVNFSENVLHRDIFKSKSSPAGVEGLRLHRIYTQNTIILEEEYAIAFGQDPFLLRKTMNGFSHRTEYATIDNNKFNVYMLSFPYRGLAHVESFNFNNNTIIQYKEDEANIEQSFLWFPGESDSDYKGYDYKHSFSNNLVKVLNPPDTAYEFWKPQSVLWNEAPMGDNVNVVIQNNYIEKYGLNYFLRDDRSLSLIGTEGTNWKNVDIRNNIIKAYESRAFAILPRTVENLVNIESNSFLIRTMAGSEWPTVLNGNGNTVPFSFNHTFTLNYKRDSQQHIRVLQLNELVDRDYNVSLKVEAAGDNGNFQKSTFNFIIRKGTTNNIIRGFGRKTPATAYTYQDYELDGSGTIYTNYYIEPIGVDGVIMMNLNAGNDSYANAKPLTLSLNTPNAPVGVTIDIKVTLNIYPVTTDLNFKNTIPEAYIARHITTAFDLNGAPTEGFHLYNTPTADFINSPDDARDWDIQRIKGRSHTVAIDTAIDRSGNGDMYIRSYTSGTWQSWRKVNGADIPDASKTEKGIIEIATDAEVKTGTDDERAVTPKGVKDNYISFKNTVNTNTGSVVLAPTANVLEEKLVFTGSGAVTFNGFNATTSDRTLIIINQTGSDITIPSMSGSATVPFAEAGAIPDNQAARFQIINDLILKEG